MTSSPRASANALSRLSGVSRREVLRVSGFLAAAGMLGLSPLQALASSSAPASAARKRVLRFAHMTDIHVQPEKNAGQGLAACLDHIGQLEAGAGKPDLIVSGGDLVMDSFDATESRTKTQWDLFTKTFADHAPVPVEHTLGNHDIWGQNKAKSKTTGSEPLWGKKWALDLLKLERPYRSFDRAGWHFVILDSVRPGAGGYKTYLDEAQMDWLQKDLAANGKSKPVVVVSHVPVFSMSAIITGDAKQAPAVAGDSLMHTDANKLHPLFAKHGVKLALSGHIHRIDRTDYDGVSYICDGAVCGSWWDGPKSQCDEGYGVIDLFDDGTFDHRYVTYGWKAG